MLIFDVLLDRRPEVFSERWNFRWHQIAWTKIYLMLTMLPLAHGRRQLMKCLLKKVIIFFF